MRYNGLRRFTAHFALHQAATALAGAFIGAYLLRSGLPLPAALLVYAGLYAARVGVRAAVLPLVRRVGYRGALALGAGLGVLQFPPLLLAEDPVWLVVWVATVSLAEATYWPVFHAAAAVLGAEGQRGREIAERQVVGLGVSVVCPLLGGWLLGTYGPAVDFGLAACFAALSTLPLALLGPVPAGPVPTMRESLRGVDFVGTLAFAADGWIGAGLGIAWPMVVFSSLGQRYEALGAVAALGAVVGAASGLLCGRCIDRGGRGRMLPWVAGALASAIALRAAEGLGAGGGGDRPRHRRCGRRAVRPGADERALRPGAEFRLRLPLPTGGRDGMGRRGHPGVRGGRRYGLDHGRPLFGGAACDSGRARGVRLRAGGRGRAGSGRRKARRRRRAGCGGVGARRLRGRPWPDYIPNHRLQASGQWPVREAAGSGRRRGHPHDALLQRRAEAPAAVGFDENVHPRDRDGTPGPEHRALGHQSAARRGPEEVHLVLQGQHVAAGGQEGDRRVAARRVGDRADHAAVEEALLLADRLREGQFDGAAAGAEGRQLRPDRPHEALAGEARAHLGFLFPRHPLGAFRSAGHRSCAASHPLRARFPLRSTDPLRGSKAGSAGGARGTSGEPVTFPNHRVVFADRPAGRRHRDGSDARRSRLTAELYFDNTRDMEKTDAIAALGALAQESRLDVFRLLVQAGADGMPAGRIGERLGLPSATLSFHLNQLRQAGLVSFRREGRSLIYAAAYDAMNDLLAYLTENCCRGEPAGCGVGACDGSALVNAKQGSARP